jgi:hypothetical protein
VFRTLLRDLGYIPPAVSEFKPDDAVLEAEARIFARYLVGRTPAPDLVARYRDANRALWSGAPGPGDAERLAFVRRHPWSVGPLDAAAALLDPAGQLRSKVLVAAAILEATPAHADDFLPRAVSVAALFWRLAVSGTAAVALAFLGVLLWPLAGRSRR